MTVALKTQFLDFIHALSWSHPTWDLFIVAFLFIGTIIYGFSMGRDRIIMILLAVYMSVVAVTRLPAIPQLNSAISIGNGFAVRISTFVGLFAVLFLMLTRSALNQAISTASTFSRWWHVVLLSFLQMGMLISVVMSFLPEQWLTQLTLFMRTLFVSPWGKFTWVVLPIIGLVIVGISSDRQYSGLGSRYE